jgi:hypothetical protein
LSPHDFEDLVRDLLQAHEGIFLESFGPGPDLGIDLRRASSGGGLIVQAKHYSGAGFLALLRALRSEKTKIIALKPNRYLLATSVSLSPQRKAKVQNTLAPFIRSPEDIFGKEDLNNLLGLHPEIEKKHFKLWLPSVPILQKILKHSAYVRRDGLLNTINSKIKIFVPNESVDKSLAKLEAEHVLIVSGSPGVGKTTLAEILCWLHMQQGWELYVIDDFESGFELFDASRKQLFLFDDFLGQVRLTPDSIRRAEARASELDTSIYPL